MKKDHLEILLEDINSKLNIVIEGHSALDRKIDVSSEKLNHKIETLHQENDTAHKALSQMIKETDQKINTTHQALMQEIKEFRQANKKIDLKTENLESRVTFYRENSH